MPPAPAHLTSPAAAPTRACPCRRPLAGTRKRGLTPQEDAALEAELLADEKESAEHVMLVDLGRNDVGKVGGWVLLVRALVGWVLTAGC